MSLDEYQALLVDKVSHYLARENFPSVQMFCLWRSTEESIGNRGNWLLLDSGAEQKSHTNDQ